MSGLLFLKIQFPKNFLFHIMIRTFFCSLFLLFSGSLQPLLAQIAITSNDGGTNTAGNLYNAVTFINGVAGGGSVTLDMSGANSVVLGQGLPLFTQSITFLGTSGADQAISIVGENEAEAAVTFQQKLTIGDGVTFALSNGGLGAAGNDSSISVGNTFDTGIVLSMGGDSVLEVTAANGLGAGGSSGAPGDGGGNACFTDSQLLMSGASGAISVTGGMGGVGANGTSTAGGAGGGGGNAAITVGSLNLQGDEDLFNVSGRAGGAGGSSTDTGGNGGSGGNASVTVVTLNLGLANTNSENFSLLGGAGGDGGTGDVGGGTSNVGGAGGAGGNASVTAGIFNLQGSGDTFNLAGGIGGLGGNSTFVGGAGGAGGSAFVTMGSLTIGTQNTSGEIFNLIGGAGGNGSFGGVAGGDGGVGGSALLSGGIISLNGSSVSVSVTGGAGGIGFNQAASSNGGGAVVMMETVTLLNSSDLFSIIGGNGADGGSGGWDTIAGSGGSASVSVGLLASSGSGDNFILAGGTGGVGYGDSGGLGGSVFIAGVTLNLTGFEDTITLTGGEGGDAGAGVWSTAGIGGNASVSMNTILLMGQSDSIVLWGGDGGGDITVNNNGGTGGNASITAGTFLIGAGESVSLLGGMGGNGGYDNPNGNNGASGGDAWLSAGVLTLFEDDILNVKGAQGGSGADVDVYDTPGSGGAGGNASVTANNFTLAGENDYIYISGGNGGARGSDDSDTTVALNYSGSGGSASLNAGTLNWSGSAGAIYLKGGNGASALNGNTPSVGGNVSAVIGTLNISGYGNNNLSLKGGTGGFVLSSCGNGGNASVSIGNFILGSLNTLSVIGGTGGVQSEIGPDLIPNGLNGSALVTIGNLQGSGTVTLNGSTEYLQIGGGNFSGIIEGDENLMITSGSPMTLSGANTYGGGTSIVGGVLVAASQNAFSTGPVVNEGTLGINGPITVNIGGNYTQSSNGTFQVGLGGYIPGLLNINGTASLSGTLQVVSQMHGNDTYQILNSAGLGGTNFLFLVDTTAGDSISVLYGADAVTLETFAPTFAQLGITANQKAVGGALDSLQSDSGNPNLINTLTALPNSALPSAYDQLSPSTLTPLFQMAYSNAGLEAGMVNQRILEIVDDGRFNSNAMAWNGGPQFAGNMPAAEEVQIAQNDQPNRLGVFVNGLDNFGTVSPDGNSPGYQFSANGLIGGVDYRFTKGWVGGLFAGYDQSYSSQSTGSVSVTGGQIGIYAGWKENQAHIEALVDGGLDSYSTQRAGYEGTATGSTSGLEYTGLLDMGYDLKADDFLVSPFVSGQWTQVSVNGFSESGSLAPLTFTHQNENYLSSDLGTRMSLKFSALGIKWWPEISAAWEHVYQGNVDSLTANFGSGDNFTVNGPATGTDAAVLGGSLNVEFDNGLSLYVEYQGVSGMANYTSQNFMGGIHVAYGGSEKIYGDPKPTAKVEAAASQVPTPLPVITPVENPSVIPTETPTAVPTPAWFGHIPF